MPELNTQSIVQRIESADIAETEFEQNVILLHIEQGAYYNFNETSSVLWQALKQQVSVLQLATLLAKKYDCTETHRR